MSSDIDVRCSRAILFLLITICQILMMCELPCTKAQTNNFTLDHLNLICTNQRHVKCDTNVNKAMNTAGSTNSRRNIISYDGDNIYALGFEKKKNNFYLSIYLWYPSDRSAGISVWTANRDFPVDENATISFLTIGSLELRTSQGIVAWSTKTEGKGVSSLVFRHDIGELLLLDGNNKTVWRSQENPSDTVIKGQTLVPGGKPLLTNDDGRGVRYSLAMEVGGLVLYAIYDNSDRQAYWVWNNGLKSDLETCTYPAYSEFFPTLPPGEGPYAAIFYKNTSANSTSGSGGNPTRCPGNVTAPQGIFNLQKYGLGPNNINALRLEKNGNLKLYSWASEIQQSPRGKPAAILNLLEGYGPCHIPDACGPYGICNTVLGSNSNSSCTCPSGFKPVNDTDLTRGCRPPGAILSSSNTTCTVFEGHSSYSMLEFGGVDYFANDFGEILNMSRDNCRQECLVLCGCRASFYRAGSGQCFHSYGALLSFRTANTSFEASIKIQNSPPIADSLPTSPDIIGIIGGVVGGVVAAAVMLCLLVAICWRRRTRKEDDRCEDDLFLDTLPGLPPRLTFKDLESATTGFSQKLGEGGFGAVYKGNLPNGRTVAVKRLEGAGQGMKEFRAEVATIGSIHHINLVRLCAFCIEGSHRLLVYEYMANGSLDNFLFSKSSTDEKTTAVFLDWETRMRIAVQTARGLAYLHEDCREKILHLDIKPQNILLDENFFAKVADFGLSKLVSRDEQSLVVTQMRGTPGYLAPEWLLISAVTDKADVYSFGICLLELVAGRKNLDMSLTNSVQRFLPAWAFQKVMDGDMEELVDKRLEGAIVKEEVKTLVRVAIWCIQEDPAARPSMGTVVQMLEGRTFIPEPPLPVHLARQTQENLLSYVNHPFSNSDYLPRSGETGSDKSGYSNITEDVTNSTSSYEKSIASLLPR